MCNERIFGGLLVQNLCSHDKYVTHNQYDIKPQIAIDENNKFYHDTDIHINSSKIQILSISGSNNRGLMLNDAQFNVTHIMEQPVFFYFAQYDTFFYAILVFFLCCAAVVLAAFVYYRRIKPLKSPSKQYNVNQDAAQPGSQLEWFCTPLPTRRKVIFCLELSDMLPPSSPYT